MTKLAFFLIAPALLSSSQALGADNRIRTLRYDAEEIVRIIGQTGIQSTIHFGPDERIENVAVGDSSAWQITPNRRGSLLFVKPLVATSRTNMTVVTDKRTYMFDLSAGQKRAVPALYSLSFSYPGAAREAAPAEQQVAADGVVTGPKIVPMSPNRLNFDWKVKGSGDLRPARIFDDGLSLYLSWSSTTQLPAILTRGDRGGEAPLDYQVAGDYIVLTPIPQNLTLRYGKKLATVWATRRLAAPTESAPAQHKPESIAMDSKPPSRSVPSASARPTTAGLPAGSPSISATNVKVANISGLHSDKLAGVNHEQ